MPKKRMWPACLAAPLMVLAVFTVLFAEGGYYPFGQKTVSWCDMSQQVVPLLAEFKDVLEGKSGFLLSHANAGGMNFWGVFFFFLASPFSFLVYWVDKEKLLLFMNILTVLKLCAAALTAALFFAREARRDGASPWLVILLSLSYAFCAYGLMYYQNSIWLDEMILFPLLLLSLDGLTRRRRALPYVLAMAGAVVVNYYIGFMVALFVMLRMGCYFLLEPHKKKAHTARCFFWSSLAAAGLSAVVWLPSLLQYLKSARTVGILDKLASVSMQAKLMTTLPTVFTLGAVAAVLLGCLVFRIEYPKSKRGEGICFLLLVIPLFLEPINCVWHAGSYMSFPSRYGFMTTFMGLLVCYRCLMAAEHAAREEEKEANERFLEKARLPLWARILFGAVLSGGVGAYCWFLKRFYLTNVSSLSAYARTLWGDENSLAGLFVAFVLAVAVFFLIYLFYRIGISRTLALFLAGTALLSDSVFAVKVYMMSVDRSSAAYSDYEDLAERLPEEDSFFRVKSASHLQYDNMEGTLGYPAAAHYTSLNSSDWLFLMKRLGYNSYWMKTSSYGGTAFSDALLSMKYVMNFAARGSGTVYQNKRYALYKSENYLPLGLLTEGSFKACEPEDYLGRIPYQEALFEALYPSEGTLFEKYRPAVGGLRMREQGDGAVFSELSENGVISYQLDIVGTRRLYLDVFSDYTNSLREPYYGAFRVSVNGRSVSTDYPSQENNGLLDLGSFTDTQVVVRLYPQFKGSTFSLKSFGLFGMDETKLEEIVARPAALALCAVNNGYEGTYRSEKEQTCFLAIPYDEGYTVLVNGRVLSYERSAQGFVSFVMPAGSGDVSIRYRSPGLTVGALISLGFALLSLILILIRAFGRKRKPAGIALFLMKLSLPLLFAAVYLFPLIWNLCR